MTLGNSIGNTFGNVKNSTSNNTSISAKIQVTPTLFVGLGGTGQKVLKRLYERLNVYYGDLQQYCHDIFKFVCIDTDQLPEIIGINNIHAGVQAIDSALNNSANSGIADWFPAMNHANNTIQNGAAAIRPYGRLAFFINYSKISSQLAQHYTLLAALNATSRLQQSSTLKSKAIADSIQIQTGSRNCVVVGSTAGGTGSGMLIDVLGYLRGLMKKSRIPGDLNVYLLGPENFFTLSNISSLRGNSYACLKELEYFQSPDKNVMEVNWDGLKNNRQKIESSLATHLFFLSGYNSYGARHTEIDEIYDLLAESIFKDNTFGDLATRKRSAIDNQKAAATTKFSTSIDTDYGEIKESYSRGFQTLGYASVNVPHDQMIEACSYQMIKNIFSAWNGGGADETAAAELLSQLRLDKNIYKTAKEAKQENGKETVTVKYESVISPIYSELLSDSLKLLKNKKQRIPDTKNSKIDNVPIAEAVDRNIKAIRSNLENGDPQINTIGAAIEERGRSLQTGLRETVSAWCAQALQNIELLSIRPVLTAVKKRVNELLEELRSFTDKDAAALKKELNTGYDNLRAELAQIQDGFFGLKNRDDERWDQAKLVYAKALGKDERADSFEGFLLIAVHEKTAEVLKTALLQLCAVLDSETERYSLDSESIKQIEGYLEGFIDAYKKGSHSSIFVSSLYDWKNPGLDEIIKTCLPDLSGSCKALIKKSLADENADIQYQSFEELKTRIAGFIVDNDKTWLHQLIDEARTCFAQTLPEKYSFWSMFQKKYPDQSSWQNQIDQFCQASSLWMQENDDLNAYKDKSVDFSNTGTDIVVGIPSLPATSPLLSFKNQVQQYLISKIQQDASSLILDPPNRDIAYLQRHDNNQLTIIRTSAPLPICYSNIINSLYEDYKIQLNTKPMHITKNSNIFNDIILPTREGAQQNLETMRTAILLLVFNRLIINRMSKSYIYINNTVPGSPQIILCRNYQRSVYSAINDVYKYLDADYGLFSKLRDIMQTQLDSMLRELPRQSADSQETTPWERYCNHFMGMILKSENADSPEKLPQTKLLEYTAMLTLQQEAVKHILGEGLDISVTDLNLMQRPAHEARILIINRDAAAKPDEFSCDPEDGFLLWQPRD